MNICGGSALSNGIVLLTVNKKAIGTIDKKGNFNIKVKSRIIDNNIKLLKLKIIVYKIPIIRGIYDFISTLADASIALLFGLIILESLKYFMPENHSNTSTKSSTGLIILLSVLLIIMIVAIILGVIKIIKYVIKHKQYLTYHGAEHKTINALENEKELTLENIRKASRVSTDCGSNFVIFNAVFTLILLLLKVDFVIAMILGYAFAFEFTWIDEGHKKFFISWFYKIALFWQEKFVVKEPSDEQILLAIAIIRALEEAEKEGLQN